MNVPSLSKEQALQQQGFSYVAGVDEAGRGAWAGPVVAAAVILPPVKVASAKERALLRQLQGVRDSKQMTARQRTQLFSTVHRIAVSVGVGVGSHQCIDRKRIIYATRWAMQRAVAKLEPRPDHLLIDALALPDLTLPQDAFPKADRISFSVAAASIVAKVTRDRLMAQLDEIYPGYGFAKHKGYGTKAHQFALRQLGPCKIHRFSFEPLRLLSQT